MKNFAARFIWTLCLLFIILDLPKFNCEDLTEDDLMKELQDQSMVKNKKGKKGKKRKNQIPEELQQKMFAPEPPPVDKEKKKQEGKTTQFGRFDNLDINALEESWGKDDDEELVKDDFQLLQEEIRKKKLQVPDLKEFADKNGKISREAMERAMANQRANPQMFFVDIGESSPSGKKWDARSFQELTQLWRALLLTGGFEDVSVYNMGEGYKKILVKVEKGWRAHEVKSFVLSQPEVLSLTWNEKEYYPEGKRPEKSEL